MPGRHKWIKLRIHVYICKLCGTGKVNEQVGLQWQTTYHMPDGTSQVLIHVPECTVGPKTLEYLSKYATDIESGGIEK